MQEAEVVEIGRKPGRVGRALIWMWRACLLTGFFLVLTLSLVSRVVGQRLARELADRRPGEIEALVPTVPAGASNAADIYQRAFDALRLSREQTSPLVGKGEFPWAPPPLPPQAWSAAEFADVREAIAGNAEYFRLLEEASRVRDCAFPVGWRRGHLTGLPHLPPLLAAGLMLRARAFVRARQGRPEEALQSCETILRIANHVQQEPALISQHTGYNLQALAVDGLGYALPQAGGGAAVCRRLSVELAKINLPARSVRAMQGERAIYGLPTFDLARQLLPKQVDASEGTRSRLGRLAPGLLLDLDELAYLKYAQEAAPVWSLPWSEAAPRAREADREVARLSNTRGLITKWVAPHVLPELLHRQETMARLGAARIALALCAFRARTGRYPAALAQLRGLLPSDPFTQRPYHYRRERRGFVVYSVGPDLTDDGGFPRHRQSVVGLQRQRPPMAGEHYDIAFWCEGE